MKQIVFTGVNKAELLEVERKAPAENEVLVKTAFSTISSGTEKANITGNVNVSVNDMTHGKAPVFPRMSGYSSSGIVVETGKNVKSVKPGDRVVVSWGHHKQFNTVHEKNVVKITYDNISFQEAAMFHICTFPLAGVRKTRLEIGESMLVMGLGLLGQLSVLFAVKAGAVPVIAVDPVAERRALALKNGADYALDPFETGFVDKVKEITGGGANTAVEVTGIGAGFDEALDCMARFGRISLLGCTRSSDFTIDYYHKIHGPGITIVGAHTQARPEYESYPGFFTQRDDIKTVMKLCGQERLDLEKMICETHSPAECGKVYDRLINDAAFPTVVQFDWSLI